MNTSTPKARRMCGSVLIIMLMLAGALVVTLGGYFWWVRSQNLLVAQSQAWNAALACAEAGIEEGLAQANVVFGTDYTNSIKVNWGALSAGVYGPMTRTLSNCTYSVMLVPTNPGPLIISTGMVTGPVLSRPVTRTVQVTTAPAFAFTKIITTRQSLTFNLKDVPSPNTAGWIIGVPPLNTNTFVLSAPYSYVVNSDMTVGPNQNLEVVGNEVVNLYVKGNFTMQGTPQPYITIAPGATLRLFVGTPNGPPVGAFLLNVTNTGSATNFQYYGLPSNTNLTWSGSAGLTGAVYAPQATLALGTETTTTPLEVGGAFVAKSVVTNGWFNFHFDPTLGTNGPISGFRVTSWREL